MKPELIDQVKSYFGTSNQIVKAIEEMSELQKELCKYLINDFYYSEESIIDELADVEIMTAQLRHIFQISDQVDKRKEFKIERLKKRISETT